MRMSSQDKATVRAVCSCAQRVADSEPATTRKAYWLGWRQGIEQAVVRYVPRPRRERIARVAERCDRMRRAWDAGKAREHAR